MTGKLIFKQFSPGLVSGVVVYIPLTVLLHYAMLKKGILNKPGLVMAFVLGGIAHYTFIMNDLWGWNRLIAS